MGQNWPNFQTAIIRYLGIETCKDNFFNDNWYTWLKTIFPGWIWSQSSDPGHWHRVGLHLRSWTGFSNGNEISPMRALSHSQIVGSSSSLLQILVTFFNALEAILFRVSVSLFLTLKMSKKWCYTAWSEGFLYKVAPLELKNSPIMYFVIHNSVVLSKILKIVVP